KYSPYGERNSTTGTESRGYIGERQDETIGSMAGLFYLHARYYDSSLARFVSPDPTVPSPRLIGLNRYAYGNKDPVKYLDKNGFDAADDFQFWQDYMDNPTTQSDPQAMQDATAGLDAAADAAAAEFSDGGGDPGPSPDPSPSAPAAAT